MLCIICGEPMAAGTRTCPNCGTRMPEEAGSGIRPITSQAPPIALALGPSAAGQRMCPACGTVHGPDYADVFCGCGVELPQAQGGAELPSAEPGSFELRITVEEEPPPSPRPALISPFEMPEPPSFSLPSGPERPPAGTPCLVLYGPDKQPQHYIRLEKDALLIGRTDAVAGIFPDIDVEALVEPGQARRVSRRHALLLRQRETGAFTLRPLPGNTGTQIDADMVAPQEDHPLAPGRRIILGGTVRFKFEIA